MFLKSRCNQKYLPVTTDKVKSGVSNLYSYTEYKLEVKKVRNGGIYNKNYLLGRYVEIPHN
jgi:hypothetical protein